jgi:hypothetical protein
MPRTKIRSRGTRKAIPQLEVMNPGKGLNVFVSENFINDAEASSLQNVETVEVGAITKRRGISAVGTGLVNAPKGLGSYVTSTVRQLLTVDGTALKYLNGTSWTSYAGGIVFTASQNTSFTQCAGYMFVHNGTDAATKLDGTTATRPGTTVSSSFGIYYHDRQFASGVATQPNRLYISSPTNVDDFTNAVDTATTHPGSTAYLGTDAKFVDIALNDGDKITALGKFQDLLIIFKERSIWSLELDSAGVPIVKLVQAGVGCVSHRGIDNVDNDLFFPTRRGYGVLGNEPNYFNAVRTNELSQRITPLYQQVTPANLSSIVSIYSDYIFYSAVPYGGTTTNNMTLTYDKRYMGWGKHVGINANAFTEFIDANNIKHLYYADASVAQVYELVAAQYNDNGSAIDAHWQSKAFDLGDPALYKRFIDISLIFRQLSGSVSVMVYTDGDTLVKSTTITSSNLSGGMGSGQMGAAWMGNDGVGTPPIGGTAATSTTSATTSTVNVPYRIKIQKTARSIKVRIGNANANENFVFLGFTVSYRPYSHFKFPSALKVQ